MSFLRGQIFLGDLVRAFDHIGVEDRRTAEAIAELLGFRLEDERLAPVAAALVSRLTPEAEPGKSPLAEKEADVGPQPDPEKPTNEQKPPVIAADEPEEQLDFSLRRDRPTPLPRITVGVENLEVEGVVTSEIPHEPLLLPRWARGIISEAASTLRAGSAPDIYKIIEAIAREEETDRLPFLKVPTLARGCQMLCDVSFGMMPFAADCRELMQTVRSTVGRERVAVFYFEDCPVYGVETEGVFKRVAYEPPPSGTPVLIVSDLGIADSPLSVRRSSPGDWLRLLAVLRAADCPPLAFNPYPPARWPRVLAEALPIIQWDRWTTAASVRASRERSSKGR